MLIHRLLLTKVNFCHNELIIGCWDNEGVCWTDLLHVEVYMEPGIQISIRRAFCIYQWKSQTEAIIVCPAYAVESRSALAWKIRRYAYLVNIYLWIWINDRRLR